MLIGACRPNSDASLMKSIGYDFIEGQVAACFVPDKGEDEWKRRRDEILALPIPLRCCNCFLPGKFRVTGPQADFAPALFSNPSGRFFSARFAPPRSTLAPANAAS